MIKTTTLLPSISVSKIATSFLRSRNSDLYRKLGMKEATTFNVKWIKVMARIRAKNSVSDYQKEGAFLFERMQRFLKILIVVMVSNVVSVNCHAQKIDLGTAAQYSGFFFGNVSSIPNIEGRLAVGGDLDVSGPSIGGRVPSGSTQASLVVGGNINAFSGGSIWANGHVNSWGVYAGTKASKVAKYLDLRQAAFSPVDFAAERMNLSILSQQLRNVSPTGTVSQLYSAVTLTGSNRDVEYFNLTADQVTSHLNFVLKNIKSTAYIILNVSANDQRQVRMSISMNVFAGRGKRVLFNLPDTDVLMMQGVRVEGNVLAPYACVKDSSGFIEGTIVAASWNTSMSIGYAPFEPLN